MVDCPCVANSSTIKQAKSAVRAVSFLFYDGETLAIYDGFSCLGVCRDHCESVEKVPVFRHFLF